MTTTAYTIGHSTHTLDDFLGLLKEYGIQTVVDIRTIPRSRYNPQFNRETLPVPLKLSGMGYIHVAGLGGLRRAVAESVNLGWLNASFRGFADYMQTGEFRQHLEELMALAGRETVCLMCAEAVPWRCHRSLISDALTVRGVNVRHILGHNQLRDHEITPFAKITDTQITYPAML